MDFNKLFLVLAVSVGLFSGCANSDPKITEGPDKVKVAQTIHEVRGCKSVGSFTVSKPGVKEQGGPDDEIEMLARERTRSLKGTHVIMKEKGPTSRVYEAFACP